MKIGQVVREYGIPVNSLYFYIHNGLLVPPRKNHQYLFDERTIADLQWILELKELECVTVKTESTSDKIGEVRATGPTLETVLAAEGADAADIKKITFHGADGYEYSLYEDYVADHDIILAFGIDGEPLDEENAPCRIIIPESDSAYWLRMLDHIEIEQK